MNFENITFTPEVSQSKILQIQNNKIPETKVTGNIIFQLCSPIKKEEILEECQYINFKSLGFFTYEDQETKTKKCFAISDDSQE
jgi:hypothetical protein